MNKKYNRINKVGIFYRDHCNFSQENIHNEWKNELNKILYISGFQKSITDSHLKYVVYKQLNIPIPFKGRQEY